MEALAPFLPEPMTFYYLLAFLLGASAGLSDLFSKYPWTLRHIIWAWSGAFYLLVNGAVSVIAYFTVDAFGVTFGLIGKAEIFRVVLVALFAMAALRSSVANVRVGNQEVAAGVAALFEPFKRRTVREMDRRITAAMLEQIAPLITGLVFSTSKNYLVAVSLTSLRTLTEEEKKALEKGVAWIDGQLIDDPTKMQLFARLLVETVGLPLFTVFAKNAKVALLAENTKATKDAEENLRRLRAAKGLLE